MLAEAVLWELRAHFTQRVDGLVSHDRLLHGAERLEQRQQQMPVGRSAHEGHKVAELLCLRQQHLVLVVGVLGQERDELAARALLAERQRDGREAAYAVQPPHRLLALEFITARAGSGTRQRVVLLEPC